MGVKIKNTNIGTMRNFFRLFNKFLNFCKLFSSGLVNALGNVVRPGPVPACSDLHVVALALSAEAMSIDAFQERLQSQEKISY